MNESARNANPLERLARRRRIVELGAGLVVIAALVWAFGSIPATESPRLNEPLNDPPSNELIADEEASRTLNPLDPEVFAAAPLWNEPAIPATEERTTEAAEPPPTLQLIGIIDQADGGRSAALYLVDRGELMIVRSGDRIERYLVRGITSDTVQLEDGRAVATLSIRDES